MSYSGEQQLPGLHPIKNPAGTAAPASDYAVSSTYATTIGQGCVVGLAETGVILANASATVATILGVAAETLAATPGSGATIKVYDDPLQKYACILDATVSNTIISIGRFTNLVSNVYNATLGQGKTMLDASEITSVVAAGDIVQIRGFMNNVGETVANTYCQAVVQLNPYYNVFLSTIKTTHLT